MLTFEASLGSMGLAVGFAISAFRFFLFRERESRLLDYINVLMQVVRTTSLCHSAFIVLVSPPHFDSCTRYFFTHSAPAC